MSLTAMVAMAVLSPSMGFSRGLPADCLMTGALLEKFAESIEALAPATVVSFTFAFRLEARLLERDFDLVSIRREVHGDEQLVIGLPIPNERVDDPLFGNDLAIDTVLPYLGAIRGNHLR